jgi:flagella basal body P-ring formation protein FlgA
MKPYALLNNTDIVKLYDIVIIDNASDETSPQNIILPDLKVTLSLIPKRTIKQALLEQYNAGLGGSVIISGGRTALIPADGMYQDDIWFYMELLSFLDSVEQNTCSRMEIEFFSAITVPENQEETSFKILYSNKKFGYMNGLIEILASFENSLPVRFKVFITQYIPLAIVKDSFKKGERIGEESLEFKEVDISLLSAEPFIIDDIDMNNLESYLLKKDIETGTPLTTLYMEKIISVKAGDVVLIHFVNGNICLDISGYAYETGSIGDTVQVRPNGTTSTFNGQVIGIKEVVVEIN